MNLLFLHKSGRDGGAQNCLLGTLAALQKNGTHRLTVVTASEGGFAEKVRRLGVEHRLLPMPEWRKWKDRLRFPGAIRTMARELGGDWDWVLANEIYWFPHAAALAKRWNAKSAAFIRDGGGPEGFTKSKTYRLGEANALLASSLMIQRKLSAFPELQEKALLLHDATEWPMDRPEQHALIDQKLAAFPDVKRWLLVVGGIGARKNQIAAVETLASLRSRGFSDLGLILAGPADADYLPRLEQVIAARDLQRHVALPGQIDDVATLFSRSEAVLLTSLSEGLPRSVVEGLLAGRPAFVFEVEGSEDIFDQWQDRFVSAPDPALLAGKVAALWQDPAGVENARQAVQARARILFSPTRHREALETILQDS